MKSQLGVSASLQSSPKMIQKVRHAAKFKIDLPNISKNHQSPHMESSSTLADRFSKISSQRITSLIKLIKKSKSNTKILKNSPYCNIPYKNQLITYFQEKEQKSMHSKRPPKDEHLDLCSYQLTFFIKFPQRPSNSFNAQNFDQYLIDAEACQQGLYVSMKKIKSLLAEKMQGGEKKFLMRKIMGFSCLEISQEEVFQKIFLNNNSHIDQKENYQNLNSPRNSADNRKSEATQETISYLLSIDKLSLSAPELKRVKVMILTPIFNSYSNKKKDVKSNMLTMPDFNLIKCLGSGGFSTVYLARCLRNNRYYALKLIDKEFIIQTERQAIVSNQRYILQKIMEPSKISQKDNSANSLRHNFVTKLAFSFETYHHFVFALEFCPGGQLFHQLKKVKKMKEEEAKFYFLEILIALDHIHSHGVVYRDLKPENLLIDEQGHIKIADFGLSKPVDDKKNLSYSFCGSPEYMAPQMLCKSGHNYLLDYYCLGALLYELVIGIPPYYSLNQDQIYNSIMTEQLSFPSNISLSAEIKNLLQGLLNKNMKKRLGSLCGIKEIFFHPWVGKIDRSAIENRMLVPPFIPNLMQANFDVEDIKSDLQAINTKIIEDNLVRNQFQSHFTDQFYFQHPKQLNEQINLPEQKVSEYSRGKKSVIRDGNQAVVYQRSSSLRKNKEKNQHRSQHQKLKKYKQKLSLKRYENSQGSINQKIYEYSHRPLQNSNRLKNKFCQSTRRFTSQQYSLDRKFKSKENRIENKALNNSTNLLLSSKNQYKNVRRQSKKSKKLFQAHKVQERKIKAKANFNEPTPARFGNDKEITTTKINDESIRQKQYRNNLIELVKNKSSQQTLSQKDKKKLTDQRNKVGRPMKASKNIRN